jgi:hypothetical protein
MKKLASSPVQPITFGQAMQTSLDSYYDVLKAQAGNLQRDDVLQLKLVSDPVAVSDKNAHDGGYRWFSYYNLLNRSDMSIVPAPVVGNVLAGIATLVQVYGKFLLKLRQYVVIKNNTPEEQKQIADWQKTIDYLNDQSLQLIVSDRKKWKDYCDAMGINVGDDTFYQQWLAKYGHGNQIQQNSDQVTQLNFSIKTLMDKQYPDHTDRDIVDADTAFNDPAMRLRYPIYGDYNYPNGDQFNVVYLFSLPAKADAMFDDRHAVTWNLPMSDIIGTTAGALAGTFDRTTSTSTSISTDWGGSASVGYDFINVSASASEHTQIQEDFKHATSITIGSKSAFRLSINFPPAWFNPTLFTCDHVAQNPHDFIEFFGDDGSLLYYPTGLILIRGFYVKFSSSQNWNYDYQHHFSASAGGGFNFCGIDFGGSATYTEDEHTHQVDQSGTDLTFQDDEHTIRFVGYSVKKNKQFKEMLTRLVRDKFGGENVDRLNQ